MSGIFGILVLQSSVTFGRVAGSFDVEDDVFGFQHGSDVHAVELTVCHGGDGGVELFVFRQLVDNFKAIFTFYGLRISPRVEDGDVEIVLAEGFDNVNHLGVSHIGAVLLEGEAEDDDVAAEYLDALLEHELDDAVRHVGAHAVVHAASGKDYLRVVAVALSTLCQVIRIHADAVSADQSRLERQEIPFRGGCGKHILRVDAHESEYLRQLVDEGDVDVALRVLYHLGGLGNLDGGREMRSGGDDAGIDPVHKLSDLRGGA